MANSNRCKRIRLMQIGRTDRFQLIENAFACNLQTYYYKNTDSNAKDIWNFLENLKSDMIQLLSEIVTALGPIKFNVLLECTYGKELLNETKDICFKTKNVELLNLYNVAELIDNAIWRIIDEEEVFEGKGSGWTLVFIDGILIRINKYQPLRSTSYLPLPKEIYKRKAVINIKNNDDYCFKWAILCKYVDGTHRERVDERYRRLSNRYDFSMLSFPTLLREIRFFEKKNNLSVNVYSLDDQKQVFPLKVCDMELEDHFDLLLLKQNDTSHYCYISDFSRLVSSQISKHSHKIVICKRCFTHYKHDSESERKMTTHLELCKKTKFFMQTLNLF
ncbi:uncharacterized protein LOC142327824 [Lycorma delicatula]|uniref:uncharacterized protein LOC142327824 n=1 Tax=Lycorma delicatula TaxID=130591 RepID=UPI003F519810